MSDEQDVRRAQDAQAFMANPLWDEMWQSYYTRIHQLLDEAKSDDEKTVMHLKRMLALAAQVRSHCTAIVQHGKTAAETIRLDK